MGAQMVDYAVDLIIVPQPTGVDCA